MPTTSPAAPTRRLRLVVGYRGARYAGWARQPSRVSHGRPTVQATLEAALAEALGHPVRATAAGRTDAGVHAEGQVVSLSTTSRLPAAGLQRALRRHLPDDLWVVEAAEAAPGFDARRHALRRWYRYALWRDRASTPPAAWRGRCLELSRPLDLGSMREAARRLLGTHDAAALATHGTAGRSTRRTLFAADWLAAPAAPLVHFEVCADAFLHHMVRTVVGSLLWVGAGRWSPDDLSAALATADRRAAGPTAPAHGLTLLRVDY